MYTSISSLALCRKKLALSQMFKYLEQVSFVFVQKTETNKLTKELKEYGSEINVIWILSYYFFFKWKVSHCLFSSLFFFQLVWLGDFPAIVLLHQMVDQSIATSPI